jgi:adhesin/invasin
MHHSSAVNARNLAITLGLAVAIAACSKDVTAPLVGNGITADAASNNQTTSAGHALTLPVAVHVTDQNGNPIANVTVTWTVVDGAGTTATQSSATDASGAASTTWTLDTLARVDSLQASIFAGTSVFITATGMPNAPVAEMKMSGDAQTDASGSMSAPFVIKVVDQFGNPVAGVAIAWAETGSGTLSAVSTITDANGMSSVTLQLGATGAYMVTATAGALAVATFSVVAQ